MTRGPEMRTMRLDAEAGRAVDALIRAELAAGSAIENALEKGFDDDVDAPLPDLSRLAEKRDRVVDSLVDFAVLGTSTADLASARKELEDAAAAVSPRRTKTNRSSSRRHAGGSGRARPEKQLPDGESLNSISASLHETGLERHDVSLYLGTGHDGSRVLAWSQVSPETAHVWLLESLYDGIEKALLLDDDLELERRASEWWFRRWSGEPRGAQELFAYGVREQEWSLVERPMMLLRTSAVAGFRDQPFWASLRPRQQQRLANMLTASFAAVFVIRERAADTTIFEGLVDGRRYEVHEHNTDIDYRPGHVALGRIIPFEGHRYLRSPGMAFVGEIDDSWSERLARMVAEGEEGMAPPIRIEMALSVMLGRGRVPRLTPPASSPREAQELVTELREMLEEHGLAERASIEDAPAEVRRSLEARADPHDVEYWRYEVDDVVREWMEALTQQALKRAKQPGQAKARKRKGRRK